MVGFFAKKFSVGLSNLNPKCPDHLLSEKKTCCNIYHFFIFGLWAVTSQTFDKKIMTGLPKLPSTVSEFFEREKLFHQEKIFPSVSDFQLRVFGLLIKKFGRLTKTALYVSRGGFWEETFKLKYFFSISLWNWVDDFQDSGGKCRKYHQSCILPVQTNILPEKGLGEKEFNTCGFSGKKSQNFGGKVSRRNCS